MGRAVDGGGARPADAARLAARPEAVPVPAVGIEAAQLHVHRVRLLGHGGGDALLHDAAHPLVGRHLPRDRDRSRRHAAAGSGSGASRVQITKPSGCGSPEATPSENGYPESFGLRLAARAGGAESQPTAASAPAPARSWRRPIAV